MNFNWNNLFIFIYLDLFGVKVPDSKSKEPSPYFLFNSSIKKWALTKFNLVPVYRKIDDKENMGGNINSFKKGYEILEKNGAFLIFPEGVSIGKRVLEKLKTGAARIGLEAEFKNDFSSTWSFFWFSVGITWT